MNKMLLVYKLKDEGYKCFLAHLIATSYSREYGGYFGGKYLSNYLGLLGFNGKVTNDHFIRLDTIKL